MQQERRRTGTGVSSGCVGAGVGAATILELALVNVHATVAINVQLVAWPAGTLEGALCIGAQLLTRSIDLQTLVNICTVVSVLGQLVACDTLAAVAPRLVSAVVLTESVVHRTLVNVKAGVAVPVEALVALAEVGANDVSTVSVSVTIMTTRCTFILIFTVCAVASVTRLTGTLITPKRVFTHTLTHTHVCDFLTFIHIHTSRDLGPEPRATLAHKATRCVHTHVPQLPATLLLKVALVHIHTAVTIECHDIALRTGTGEGAWGVLAIRSFSTGL